MVWNTEERLSGQVAIFDEIIEGSVAEKKIQVTVNKPLNLTVSLKCTPHIPSTHPTSQSSDFSMSAHFM